MKTPPFLKDFIDLFFPRLCPVCQRNHVFLEGPAVKVFDGVL